MSKPYLRGDMYYADLGTGIGSEQNGRRPVVIIQNDTGNKHSPTVIVAAISSRVTTKAKLPTHYYIDAESGLELPSIVLLEQLRTVDKRRLDSYIGRLSIKHMHGIDLCLATSIGLSPHLQENTTLTLCSTCADSFRRTGAFSVFRAISQGQTDGRCAYCKQSDGARHRITFIAKD